MELADANCSGGVDCEENRNGVLVANDKCFGSVKVLFRKRKRVLYRTAQVMYEWSKQRLT